MKTLSRHLPPAQKSEMNPLGGMLLIAFSIFVIFQIYNHPIIIIPLFTLFLGYLLANRHESKQLQNFIKDRSDNICSFRKSFNLKIVDPWIVRASYEAFQSYLGKDFPLRASDRIEEDLHIDSEDLEDIANEVFARTGYDVSDNQQNPFYNRVKTVEDFVLFFTHQKKVEQGAAANP